MVAALMGAAIITGVAAAYLTIELPRQRAAQQIALGRSVYMSYCAVCHGTQLQGQPDWQTPLPSGRLPAPPHDASGHTWHHGDEMLLDITKNGLKRYAGENYESDMPLFADILKDGEIRAAIEYIKSTWPEREREYQRTMTSRMPPAPAPDS